MARRVSDNGAVELPLGTLVRARFCEPAGFGTADCAQVCRCDDGSDYAVKDERSGALVPHSEWFCTKLGEAVGLASPPCKIVEVEDARCFGSRWETGHDARDWWLRAVNGEIDFSALAPTLSRILAFDLFVNNIDRHLTNFIVRPQHFGISLLAFDYSRAWIVNGFPPPIPPMGADTKTIMVFRFLKSLFGDFLDFTSSNYVLDKLRLISVEQIEFIIAEHPSEWLTSFQREAILLWWSSGLHIVRIDALAKGVKDGSCL